MGTRIAKLNFQIEWQFDPLIRRAAEDEKSEKQRKGLLTLYLIYFCALEFF